MKLLLLRGQVPKDRNPKEICHSSISEEDDVWTHLAYHLGDERCEVVYWGGNRCVKYSDTCTVRWVKSLKHYKPDFEPDVVWARGGFPEYASVLKKYENAVRVYYGSGARYCPKDKIPYDLVLCDSLRQYEKVTKRGYNGRMWIKPAVDTLFYPRNSKKKYDVGYVGDARFPFRARIKGIDRVYNVPKDLKMLHLGWSGKYKVPKNVKVKRVKRWKMAEQICKCKVIVVPYRDYDSCPRIIPEALACGVPVVALESCHFWNEVYPVALASKQNLWDVVRKTIGSEVRECYQKYLTLDRAVVKLRELIENAKGKGSAV